METLFNASSFSGYVYPNETVVPWTVLIVVYPYLTGLVAGAFTISSLYQVFGFQQLRPVAHFALLISLCCMVVVPLPLLLHLGHPERAFNGSPKAPSANFRPAITPQGLTGPPCSAGDRHMPARRPGRDH